MDPRRDHLLRGVGRIETLRQRTGAADDGPALCRPYGNRLGAGGMARSENEIDSLSKRIISPDRRKGNSVKPPLWKKIGIKLLYQKMQWKKP